MSFAFMPIYTGDYIRDTRHLSPQKHGVYFLLLMHCWDQKGPVPLDEQESAGIANCRSSDEIEALRYVLGRFFVKMDDGYYNLRMQREIERSEAISKARSEAGFKGYQSLASKRQANAGQVLGKSQAPATTPTPTLTPTPIPKTTKNKDTTPTASDVDSKLWNGWLRIRRAKKLPLTEAALKKIRAEAALAGLTLEEAIRTACENSWAGFKAAWLHDGKVSSADAAAAAMKMLED